MSFNCNYFSQMAYGGQGGNAIWHYRDYNDDNVASLAGGSVNAGYFSDAYDTYGIVARRGDIILVFSESAANVATPCMAAVVDDWDTNGASVIVAGIGVFGS